MRKNFMIFQDAKSESFAGLKIFYYPMDVSKQNNLFITIQKRFDKLQ